MQQTIIYHAFTNHGDTWFDPQIPLSGQSLFTLPQWLKTWWEAFKPDAQCLFIAVYQDKEPIGLAPLMVQEEIATFVGDPEIIDYQDCLVAPGKAHLFFSAVLTALKAQNISRLDLRMLRPTSWVLTTLVEIAHSRHYQVAVQQDAMCTEIALPATWAEYMAMLQAKQRKEIKRKIKRLEAAGQVDFRVMKKVDEETLEQFFHLFKNSRQDKAEFMTKQMMLFFRKLMLSTSQSGLLRLGVLRLDEQIVAMSLVFYYQDRMYLYNSAYHPEYRSLSVGLLSHIFSIKYALAQNGKVFDFLRGNETYKAQLGGQPVYLSRCQITLA